MTLTLFLSLSLSFAEHVDIDEAKSIFESNYSHVYFILYDTFVQAETNLRQRGKLFILYTPLTILCGASYIKIGAAFSYKLFTTQ